MVNDKTFDTQIDRLLYRISLGCRVAMPWKEAEVDTERTSLALGSRLIGLEEVSLRNQADQSDLNASLIERSGRAGDAGSLR
jgi:hypothetical protein